MKKAALKGYLFEALIKKIVSKAGFRDDFISKQITWNRKKFHGRGAVHQIDVFGEFYFSIPFIYPINILGEVKAYRSQVKLPAVRNFCGAAKDILEWYRVETNEGGKERFSAIGEKRHTHCPAFFSLNGFSKPALEYMYAQGIYPITYENNREIFSIYDKFDALLKQIVFKRLPKRYTIFKRFEDVLQVPSVARKRSFLKRYNELMERVSQSNPYFGMLGGKYIVNIFFKDKRQLSGANDTQEYQIDFDGSFRIKSNGTEIAEFSFSRQFIRYYLTSKTKVNETFSYIDVFAIDENKKRATIHRLSFDAASKNALTNKLSTEVNNA